MGKRAKRSDVARAVTRRKVQSVRTLTSEAEKNVGRPGFGGNVPGLPAEGKASVRRVRQIDPARGITQPGADIITNTHIDLVGDPNPGVKIQSRTAAPNAGSRVIRPPRQSAPVYSNRPGKVTRPGR